jgi:hypothetical protein
MTLTELRQTWWRNSAYLVYSVIVVELGLFIVFFLSTRSWLLVSSGIPLFGGVVWCMVSVQRSDHWAPKIKRGMWFVLLPLMAIAFRLVEAILNWR